MNRREFLLGSAGAGGVAMAAGGEVSATPKTEASAGNARSMALTGDSRLAQADGSPDGETVQVDLVNYAFEPGTDEPLTIPPGTTVNFVWQTDNHNIEIDAAPAESEWEGVSEIHNSGYETQHTFEVTGTYEFFCRPHLGQGMTGTIVVEEGASLPGEGEQEIIPPAERELDPHEIGVPLQKHFLGIAAMFGIFLTLTFAFYVLKYGESPHTGSPNRRE